MKTFRSATACISHCSSHSSLFRQPEVKRTARFLPTSHNRRANHRTFVSPSSFNLNPFASEPQRFAAHRTIAHPSSLVYSVISDVGAYSSFLPFCQKSIVTKYSSPTGADGKIYPEEAELMIGFGSNVAESFTSRVYCVPGRVVEAVSGSSETSLPANDIAHHGARPPKERDPVRLKALMEQLRTRWTLRTDTAGAPQDPVRTEVDLVVEFQFVNPLYNAMSMMAAPKVADQMIEAFEKRVAWMVKERAKFEKREAQMGKEKAS